MVLFSLTAQILDTILIKGTTMTAEVALSVVTWSVRSAYRWYCPPPLTETQLLKLEVQRLREEVNRIETPTAFTITETIENNDGQNYIVIG